MTEDPEGRARLQRRVAAVLADVVQVDETRVERRIAHVGGEQPALGVQAQRLMR